MAGTLEGKKIAFLVANEGVEQVELTEPWEEARREGAETDLIAPDAGEVQAFNHLDKGDTFPVDRTVADVSADDYDALVLPGGVANPDNLRADEDAVAFVRAFFEQHKPVAAICHAPWTLVEADVVQRPHADLVAEPADRHPQRRRQLGRRGGRRRPGPRDQPQAGRPARVQREAGRGGRRGQARGADRVSYAGRDPRRRRHARRHELPPRDRVVPRLPPARPRVAAVAHPPAHRHGRRPARRRPRR